MVFLCELALVTPPFGISLFIAQGIHKDSSLQTDLKEIIQGAIPFIIVDFLFIILIVAFPQIALFLPNRMR